MYRSEFWFLRMWCFPRLLTNTLEMVFGRFRKILCLLIERYPHRTGVGTIFPTSYSCDLNPLNYILWSVLEASACANPQKCFEAPKRSLIREWKQITPGQAVVNCWKNYQTLPSLHQRKRMILWKNDFFSLIQCF